MVEVRFLFNLGNNLFQYCFGRIIAENLGFELKASPIPGFPHTRDRVNGLDHRAAPEQIISHDYPEDFNGDYSKVISWKNGNLRLENILKDTSPRKIVIEGYFQRYEYYRPYKELIRDRWLAPEPSLIDTAEIKAIDKDDVVLSLRRGDYVPLGHALPFSYYRQALSHTKFKRLFICCDDCTDPFISLFKKYKPIVIPSNPLKNFYFTMSFNKIIMSNSSFSWWAAFLSHAREIYAPIPRRGFWSGESPEIDLTVDDEKRFVYIRCEEEYKRSLSEKMIAVNRLTYLKQKSASAKKKLRELLRRIFRR